jgi:predicted N-acetyltransferase YhbS
MNLTPIASIQDVMRARDFLLQSYRTLGTLRNWEPRRLEGLVFHRNSEQMMETRLMLRQSAAIASDAAGNIEAVLIPEYPGGMFIQHIAADTEQLQELLRWAESTSTQTTQGISWLEVWCPESDTNLQRALEIRSFSPTSDHQIRRSLRLPNWQPPALSSPENFVARSITPSDYQQLADMFNAAFGRTFHTAEEYANFAQLAPSYSAEFEIVIEEISTGRIAAHAGLTPHFAESFVVVEPVCTHPDFENLGLARAAIIEGLLQAQSAGITTAFIEAWYSNPVSNHVYSSLGFENPQSTVIWRKETSVQ